MTEAEVRRVVNEVLEEAGFNRLMHVLKREHNIRRGSHMQRAVVSAGGLPIDAPCILVTKDARVPAGRTLVAGSGLIAIDEGPGKYLRLSATGGAAAPHNLLSAEHADTTAAACVQGDVLTGQAGGVWARLPIGGANKFLGSDGTDAAWAYPYWVKSGDDITYSDGDVYITHDLDVTGFINTDEHYKIAGIEMIDAYPETSGDLTNLRFGYNCYGALLTGASGNVALGEEVFSLLTSGDNNFGALLWAGSTLTTGSGNIIIGKLAMGEVDGASGGCVALGEFALDTTSLVDCAVAVGCNALYEYGTSADYTVGVGLNAGYRADGYETGYFCYNAGRDSTINYGVVIGPDAGKSVTADYIVTIGPQAGNSAAIGDYSILIGFRAAGDDLGAWENSIAIGKQATITKSNQVVLGNSSIVETLLYGKVGIGMTPEKDLDVAGDIRATGQLMSTVAIGTAPLSAVSTTVCANLNADLLDGNHAAAFAAAAHNHAAGDITSGALLHERGGLEADVSAYDGMLRITGGATSAITLGNSLAYTLSVLDTIQDIRTTASPTFVTTKLSGLTNGYVPYHVADATGLANSPLYTDGTSVGLGTTTLNGRFNIDAGTTNIQVCQFRSGAPSAIYTAYRTSGAGVAFNLFDCRVQNDVATTTLITQGIYGNANLGGTPFLNYLYIGDAYDNNALRVYPTKNVWCGANLGINVVTFGASADKVFGIGSGTAPSTSPADVAQLWVGDINAAAGKAGFHMRTENSASLIVPGVLIKTDTGNPAYDFEGMICINTFDNTLKMYADAGWRQLATW